MTIKVAINGFGRIGRNILRAIVENNITDVTVVAINDLTRAEILAHLLEFDSVHGRFDVNIEVFDNTITVNGNPIVVTAMRNPADLPWNDIDVVLECTGIFKSKKDALLHLENGSKQVLISAPGKDVDRTVVYGVNHKDLTTKDLVVSNASCTTNCLAPLAMVLDNAFGIETGYMTTIHSYTGGQPTHDRPGSDLYRSRAAALSMVPTTTGAAKALALVLPKLKGVIDGSAVRVPVPNVSAVDLKFMPKKTVTVEEINKAVKAASEGALDGILGYDERPLVSTDFNHDPRSSIFAPDQTTVTNGNMVRVFSWYDNEWGFSNRMIDTARYMATVFKKG